VQDREATSEDDAVKKIKVAKRKPFKCTPKHPWNMDDDDLISLVIRHPHMIETPIDFLTERYCPVCGYRWPWPEKKKS
jgi:hypothetical protein